MQQHALTEQVKEEKQKAGAKKQVNRRTKEQDKKSNKDKARQREPCSVLARLVCARMHCANHRIGQRQKGRYTRKVLQEEIRSQTETARASAETIQNPQQDRNNRLSTVLGCERRAFTRLAAYFDKLCHSETKLLSDLQRLSGSSERKYAAGTVQKMNSIRCESEENDTQTSTI